MPYPRNDRCAPPCRTELFIPSRKLSFDCPSRPRPAHGRGQVQAAYAAVGTAVVGRRASVATTGPLPANNIRARRASTFLAMMVVASGVVAAVELREILVAGVRKSLARDRPDNGPEALIQLPF